MTGEARRELAMLLPDFPWDLMADYKVTAAAHPDGLIDLSMGSPVDPVPASAQAALAAAANSPGYPATHGTPLFRAAVSEWMAESIGVLDYPADAVLPTMGSKEAVGWLPFMLGLGAEHTVVVPSLAYPTYEVGALAAGCRVVRADDPGQWPAGDISLVWVNSPGNPTGEVLPPQRLREVVRHARQRGAILASDECYIELTWGDAAASVLSPQVCEGDVTGLLALHSLSKRSNMAGYRVATITGDPALVGELLQVRKHLGHLVPAPVLAAATAAYSDREHAAQQRSLYGGRRRVLSDALSGAGFEVAEGGSLFIWASRGQDCWQTVAALAESGILVAPGVFYGELGSRHVRVAVTATDAAIAQAVQRLASFA